MDLDDLDATIWWLLLLMLRIHKLVYFTWLPLTFLIQFMDALMTFVFVNI